MEKVNHPSHYNIEGKRECIEAMKEDYGHYITAIFCLMSAYKYLYRAGIKEGESQKDDIAKAQWYFDYQEKLSYDFDENTVALYKYVEKELKRYDTSRKY